jgi:hypothetical protein
LIDNRTTLWKTNPGKREDSRDKYLEAGYFFAIIKKISCLKVLIFEKKNGRGCEYQKPDIECVWAGCLLWLKKVILQIYTIPAYDDKCYYIMNKEELFYHQFERQT